MRRDAWGELAVLARVICCSGNCRITLSAIGYAKPTAHRERDFAAQSSDKSTENLWANSGGCLVQTHHAIDLLVLSGERSRIK